MEMNHGQSMYRFAEKIFPITRSLTGDGFRETLKAISNRMAETAPGTVLNVYEVPTGTQVFDWTVPKEWAIRAAYIEDEAGNRIIDMNNNNLHVMGYSVPVDAYISYDELITHVYTEENQPDVIPYVTSYYRERYGFCMTQRQKESLDKSATYHVVIDSSLFDGVLNYGEVVIPGDTEEEVFFSTYLCHPSMANNECSGPALASELIAYVSALPKRKYTYRFVFVPETIGSITYLSRNLPHLKKTMKAGFVLSCVGDNFDYSIVESRYADTEADRVLKNVLSFREKYSTYSFLKRGSDERQYGAPGVELPVVCFCRSKFGEFPEYHTSADNMDFVSPEGFQGSFDVMSEVITALEGNFIPKMTVLCEPQLGKRGLYPTVSKKGSYDAVYALTNFITYADGRGDLVDISNRIHIPVSHLLESASKLMEAGLMEAVEERREV